MLSAMLLCGLMLEFHLDEIEVKKEPTKFTVPDLEVGTVPEPFNKISPVFKKSISVFGIPVLATADFDAAKHRHVAAVLAEYLDNDEDGKPDNPKVVEAMASRAMAMILFSSEREMERLDRSGAELYDFRYLQGQFESETLPRGEFDATIEEVLHLVTMGYCEAYPRVFGTLPGTELADCLDRARGGHYSRVPRKYPEEAWFHYDDRSCEYGCMAVEYLYWGLTSLLGAQAEPQRGREISHEWKLNTAEKMREGDPWLTALLTAEEYRWAKVLPDGNYSPAESE